MASINTIKPGDVLYSVERVKMGNTTMSREVSYTVSVKEVNVEQGWILASWNCNTPTKMYGRRIAKLRRTPKVR